MSVVSPIVLLGIQIQFIQDVAKKFSVRYYLNLVLVDEEDRRYFKQQVRPFIFNLQVQKTMINRLPQADFKTVAGFVFLDFLVKLSHGSKYPTYSFHIEVTNI